MKEIRDQIIDSIMKDVKTGDYFSRADAADKVIGLLSREYIETKQDSILTMEAICQKYEDFLLHDEHSYNNSVIIRDSYHEDAFFVLHGSYHLQIACKSLCGSYIHTAYDADYERRYTKGWEVVETFTSKEELEMFTLMNNEVAYKYQHGNGMTAYVVDTYLVSKRDGSVYEDKELYYIDEDTGLVYKECHWGYKPENSQEKITSANDTETYVEEDYYGPGKSEEVYYQLQNGLEGLKEYYESQYSTNNSLSCGFSTIKYKFGHCDLNLDHVENTTSIMSEKLMNSFAYEQFRTGLIKELFVGEPSGL